MKSVCSLGDTESCVGDEVILEKGIFLWPKKENLMKDWTYNEFNQVGIDYSKPEKVHEYDDEMESFRDYDDEARIFVEKIKKENPQELIVADIGCGTGAFSIHASRFFKKIYAVDISQEMLNLAAIKAKKQGITNIEFVNSGFLQFNPVEQIDIVHTKWAFHHLPDYWKQAALLNINNMLLLGGVFYLADVVFKSDHNYESNIDVFIEDMAKKHGNEFAHEVKVHIKEEYSTFDWIIQGLIERAGFEIKELNDEDILLTEYLCTKTANI